MQRVVLLVMSFISWIPTVCLQTAMLDEANLLEFDNTTHMIKKRSLVGSKQARQDELYKNVGAMQELPRELIGMISDYDARPEPFLQDVFENGIEQIVCSHNGQYFAVVKPNEQSHGNRTDVCVYDAYSGQLFCKNDHSGTVKSVTFSDDDAVMSVVSHIALFNKDTHVRYDLHKQGQVIPFAPGKNSVLIRNPPAVGPCQQNVAVARVIAQESRAVEQHGVWAWVASPKVRNVLIVCFVVAVVLCGYYGWREYRDIAYWRLRADSLLKIVLHQVRLYSHCQQR